LSFSAASAIAFLPTVMSIQDPFSLRPADLRTSSERETTLGRCKIRLAAMFSIV
jgi:hypothetical protein